ncbi:MAG TPA: hypothetical protein VII72_13735 [Myxococcota bacterium]|jgi:hypothetical protein
MQLAAPSAGAQIDPQAAGLCADVLESAEQASRGSAPEQAFRLCDALVTLRVAGGDFEAHLTRALRHAGAPPGGAAVPALRVFALDGRAAAGRLPPVWPFSYADQRHLERLHVSADRRVYVRLDEDTRTWQVFDRARRRAAIWTEDASRLPDWEQSFPLRTLLNWLLAPSPASLAHAAVVCDGERGLLLAGPGGSGKSTTTVACLEIGMQTCGDDFVAVTGGAAPRAHALFDTVKLDERSLALFPHLAPHAVGPGPARGSKARIHLSELCPARLRPSCSLAAIVVPRVAPGEPTRVAPLAKTAALRALVPSTVFLTRGAELETAAKLGALVRTLPTWDLCIGGAPDEAARALRALLAEGSP